MCVPEGNGLTPVPLVVFRAGHPEPAEDRRRMRSIIALGFAALLAGCASTNETAAVTAMGEALSAVREHDLVRAKASAEHALELRPGFVDPMMLLASIAEHSGDWEAARSQYLNVLRSDPTDTAAGVALGVTYVREQRFADAREWFTKAMTADPGCEAAAYNLGSLNEQTEDLEAAAAWFDVAATLDQRDPRALVEIAKIRMEQARFQEALAAADLAISRYPSSVGAQRVRSLALGALGRN